jgi:Tol biopolymer transport system component
MRKILFIIGAFLVVLLIGLFIYLLFKKPSLVTPPSSKIRQVQSVPTPEKIFYPALSLNGKSLLYLPGQELSLHEFNLQTQKDSSISPDYFAFVKEVSWSPNKDKLVIWVLNTKKGLEAIGSPFINKGAENSLVLPYLFDLSSKKASLLSSNIKQVTWTPDGKKIVYQYLDKVKGVNNLSIADPDGKNWKKVIDLKDENIFLNTLGTGEIVYAVSETTDSFSAIKTDGSGKRTIKLPISVNINKIAWSSDGKSLIAAIREKDKATDALYKINLESGQKEEIKYESKTPIDAKNLMLTKDNKTLYFTSDDYLYRLSL